MLESIKISDFWVEGLANVHTKGCEEFERVADSSRFFWFFLSGEPWSRWELLWRLGSSNSRGRRTHQRCKVLLQSISPEEWTPQSCSWDLGTVGWATFGFQYGNQSQGTWNIMKCWIVKHTRTRVAIKRVECWSCCRWSRLCPNSDMGRHNFGMTQQQDDCFISNCSKVCISSGRTRSRKKRSPKELLIWANRY